MAFHGTPSMSKGWIVPKKYLEQVGDDGFKKHPIGAGPYKFVSQKPGIELVLEAYEGYWRKVPHVQKLIMRSIPDDSTRLAMLKTGEADIAYAMMGSMAEETKRDPQLKLAYSWCMSARCTPRCMSWSGLTASVRASRNPALG